MPLGDNWCQPEFRAAAAVTGGNALYLQQSPQASPLEQGTGAGLLGEILGMTKAEVEALQQRCQIGVGGRNALDQAHDILAECYGALGALDVEVARLRGALKEIAELGSFYAVVPEKIRIARKTLGCKRMPY